HLRRGAGHRAGSVHEGGRGLLLLPSPGCRLRPLGRPGVGPPVTSREEEVAANLERVRDRIEAACVRAGRSPDEVTLTVVTKFFPASDVRILAGLGVRH